MNEGQEPGTVKVSERSVQLIKQYMDEIELPLPLDFENAGYNILKFFEHLDGAISTWKDEGKDVDETFVKDVDYVIQEFFSDNGELIDYADLQKRLGL